jgi:carboxyl-terminal processing protease
MMHRSRTAIALLGGLALGVVVSSSLPLRADRERASAIAAAPAPAATTAASAARAAPDPAELHRMAEIIARVRQEYVDDVPADRLVEQALRGMVGGLDPYSAYLDSGEYADIRASTAGSYPGIGIEVEAERGGIKVLRPLADSPAERAGLRSGDLILRIDDAPVGADVDAAIHQMRGPEGSRVMLTVRRGGTDELVDVALERALVEVHTVAGTLLEPGHAYLRIDSFSDTTPADLRRVVAELRDASGPLRGIVLDLRNNPGGVLESAVEVADDFLESGVIVTATGRAPDARFRLEARPGQIADAPELVVLVNGASASAAEILAGALKDHGRAQLVGRRTFGKGSVQTVIPLPDGRALKLTTSVYATPSGARIDQRGIEPDVELEGPEAPLAAPSRDAEVAIALRLLRDRRGLPPESLRAGEPGARGVGRVSSGLRPPRR